MAENSTSSHHRGPSGEHLAPITIHSTPKSKDIGSHDDHHSGSKATAVDKERNLLAFHGCVATHSAFDHSTSNRRGGTIEDFLLKFVPSASRADLPIDEALKQSLVTLAKNIPVDGAESSKHYRPIIELLMKCQDGFDSSRKINFQDTHSRKLHGPTERDHHTGPDILAPHPGEQDTPPSDAGYDQFCSSAEVKVDRDPFELKGGNIAPTDYNVGTISQLVKNARNLLFASSSCYVFVIGIYCETQMMRIYRFDHCGSVSCAFNYVEKPEIIREFLWRLVNPQHKVPNTVVGWDETIRFPSKDDRKAMKPILKNFYPDYKFKMEECRWVRVRLDRTALGSWTTGENLPPPPSQSSPTSSLPKTSSEGQDPPYYDVEGLTFGPPLYKSSGLVSRATHVTRILVNVPHHGYHVFVMKDAWHQQIRKPESEFYERIQQRFSELKTRSEFDWVRMIYPDIDQRPNWIPGLSEYYGYLDLSTIESPSTPEERGHTTVTSRLLKGNELSDRTRGRCLTRPVGNNLLEFDTTRELIIAIRDAIVGHFIACSCGVLHRDISIGNVLRSKRFGQLHGFLHDFDYATFIKCAFGLEKPGDDKKIDSNKSDLKVMTGTPQFMAIDVLELEPHDIHHDLESFYWVLIWIILRHAHHDHKDGNKACTNLFDHDQNSVAIRSKRGWLSAPKAEFEVESNPPLNVLLEDLRRIIFRYNSLERNIPTHEMFIRVLNKALESSDWPPNDSSLPFDPPGAGELMQEYLWKNRSGQESLASRHSERLAIRSQTPSSQTSQKRPASPGDAVVSNKRPRQTSEADEDDAESSEEDDGEASEE